MSYEFGCAERYVKACGFRRGTMWASSPTNRQRVFGETTENPSCGGGDGMV